MRRFLILLVLFLSPVHPVAAADAPAIAAPASWIEAVDMAAPDPAQKEKPFQPLLLSMQSLYAKGSQPEHFVEYASLIQNPQGLAALGNVVIGWQPDQSELIVHKVHILRGGKTIDLLANGQEFTVLRRENGLEAAMLDGVLTAVMQPEGLSVGDILHVAWTVRHKAGALDLRPENFYTLAHGFPIRRLRMRELWDKDVPIRWRASDAIGKPKVKTAGGRSELLLDLTDAEAPKPPENAPPRYTLASTLEVSGYGGWGEVGSVLTPVYREAQQLRAESPLKAEIERIAAASADPKVRAMAALRLVQDRIRYLAMQMGDGGLVPASADQTWSRKFGDCKGKTATLLALLSGLGIEAEPVLVSSVAGDGLEGRLPMVGLFDHVLVRARIAGRAYWLDGTRSGDRDLDSLASAPFGWGLPLNGSATALEKISLAPPPLPLTETSIVWDASAGFNAPVPVSGEILFRGDMATALRLALPQTPEKEMRDAVANLHPTMPAGDDLDSFEISADEESGVVTARFKARARMDWQRAPGSSAVRFHFDDSVVEWLPDFKREQGPSSDAPFQLVFPVFLASTETVILPRGGEGFTLEGSQIDETVGGTAIRRTAAVENGRAVVRSSFRKLQGELPAAQGPAAQTRLEAMADEDVWVHAPESYKPSAAEVAALIEGQPRTVDEYLDRGYHLMQEGRVKEALADFDEAVKLDPKRSRGHANRGIALAHSGKYDEATAALDKAASLSEQDFVVWQGRGLVNLGQDRPEDAVAAFSRSLALEPDSGFDLSMRAQALLSLGRIAEAKADIGRYLAAKPDNLFMLEKQARLLAFEGNHEDALDAADRMVAAAPGDPHTLSVRARLLGDAGRREEAKEAWKAALAAIDIRIAAATNPLEKLSLRERRSDFLAYSGASHEAVAAGSELLKEYADHAILLNSRCWHRATANIELELALKDCDRALSVDPENAAIADSRGVVKLRLGRLDDAIADFDLALTWRPDLPAALYGRGLARLRKGDAAGGERDLARARRFAFDIDSEYRRYGLTPPTAPPAGPEAALTASGGAPKTDSPRP